ncbi:unnamed protein product [Oikopleura dioica]|uniref:Uncharacterized protein n=1 Tax=Oikopleura dioica TaxID=34765 RepID=E4YRQ9_OIKDI|nr:unnamed protein product [Oikopleura dioica]
MFAVILEELPGMSQESGPLLKFVQLFRTSFSEKKNGAVQLKSASVPSKRVLVTHYEGIIQT